MSTDLIAQLEEAAAPSEDHTDPRFFTVLTHVEKGSYSEAKRLISELFKEGYYDIRLVCYALYADLFEQGIGELSKVLQLLVSILTSHWEKLYPIKDRERQARSGLSWFFNMLVGFLDHTLRQVESGGESDFWQGALSLDIEQVEAIESSLREAQVFFTETWPEDSIANEKLPQILRWISELKKVVGGIQPLPDPVEEPQAPVDDKQVAASVAPPRVDDKVLPIGPLEELKEKLAMFERLVDSEAFAKAAVVADDITTIIANFNPAHYFPTLFASYFAKLAKHTAAIEHEWEAKESFSWSVLLQLYATDRSAFEKWK